MYAPSGTSVRSRVSKRVCCACRPRAVGAVAPAGPGQRAGATEACARQRLSERRGRVGGGGCTRARRGLQRERPISSYPEPRRKRRPVCASVQKWNGQRLHGTARRAHAAAAAARVPDAGGRRADEDQGIISPLWGLSFVASTMTSQPTAWVLAWRDRVRMVDGPRWRPVRATCPGCCCSSVSRACWQGMVSAGPSSGAAVVAVSLAPAGPGIMDACGTRAVGGGEVPRASATCARSGQHPSSGGGCC